MEKGLDGGWSLLLLLSGEGSVVKKGSCWAAEEEKQEPWRVGNWR